ncbi:MAG: AAA family ATPase [Tannerella sp.]|jgi:hypothetical protein|nr:AAA family ATPase [Tannerella sp.]
MDKEVNQYGEKSAYFEHADTVNLIYNQVESSQLTIDDILQGFNSASVDLSSYKNKFGGEIHIERTETTDLYNWIVRGIEPNESPIAILTGNAGYGKSVILRDLFDKLQEEKIPVLGIKADRIVIHNLEELNKELELGDTIESIFKALSSNSQKFVLLIDQIDALSQSLSSDRSPLNTYHRLILKLSRISNIRIVISCRLYDLDYDPLLQEYKEAKTFKTSALSVEEVVKVLETLKMQVPSNAVKLKEFLGVPLHLQLFCKINSPEKFSETTTLQTLYDEIWQDFILQKPHSIRLDSIKLQKLVEEIAHQMYDSQQLVVSQKLFEGKYKKELDYLSSEEIITMPEHGKIQFIHQSFFDYAYARTFIEKGEVISDSLQAQHQGLFIRSRVKQVFTYLRELDSQRYIQEFEKVLFGNNRFHLKLLLINNLGFYSNPLIEEKRLIKEKLIKNDALFKLFIESAYTQEWFKFLVKDINIAAYFEKGDKEYIDIIYSLCWKMLKTNAEDTIDFLTKLNNINFENKSKFIGNLLSSVPKDKVNLSFSLFEQLKSTWDTHNFYHYLKTAIQNYPDFVIQELREQVIDNLPHIDMTNKSDYIPGDYNSWQVYKELFEKHRDKAAVFFIELTQQIAAFPRLSDQENQKDSLFTSWAYVFFVPFKGDHLYFHQKMYDMVLGYLDDLFGSDFEKAKAIILPLLKSDYGIVVNIPVYFMCKYPEQFKNESFEMLSTGRFYTTATDSLDYNIKELLRASYPLFSQEEQQLINKVIMGLKPEWEKDVYGEKGVSQYGYTRIGRTAYQLISMIPDKLRKKYPEIDRFYKEKFRQYGELKNEAPQGVIMRSGETSMSKSAYEHMNDAQWKESFKKHISDRHLDWDVPTRTGHGRSFEDYVSLNPNKFIFLISDIIEDEEILPMYVIYGLQGLKKGNYNPQKTKELFVRFITKRFYNNRGLNKEVLRYSVWFIAYFIEESVVDQDIIDFLTELVVNYEDEKMLNDDPLQDGINRTRGAASLKLVQCYKFPEYKEDIFSALEKMATHAAVNTRAAALYQLAYLNHLDIDRNRNLFLTLMSDYHPLLLKGPLHNLHPLVYLIHQDFSKLIDFFANAIAIEQSHEMVSHILFIAWLNDYEKSKELLDKVLEKSDIARRTVVKAAFESIEHGSKCEDKCWDMLHHFLDEDNEELGKVYEHGFLRIDEIEYSKNLEDFLDKYAHSSIGKYRGYYFYTLLLNLSKDIPQKCIEWALQFEEHEMPDIQERMLQNEPLQVVIHSYNAIREYDKNNPALEMAMNAFDRMLAVPEYRGSANDVLQKIDA